MLEHGFEAWENPEIPISMLGLSEDEVKADGRYTKSTSESETYDAEYTIEQGKKSLCKWKREESLALLFSK